MDYYACPNGGGLSYHPEFGDVSYLGRYSDEGSEYVSICITKKDYEEERARSSESIKDRRVIEGLLVRKSSTALSNFIVGPTCDPKELTE
jgi:hypothetical protein